jgi:nucleotide-binding universal stress UspA family protein
MAVIAPKRILVPIDGNSASDEIVALACTIAQRTKGEVQVIYIIEVKRTLPLDADLPPEAEKGEMVLEQAERVAEKFEGRIQADLLQARDVGPTIVDEARERGADLIVISSHGRTGLGRILFGSTAEAVVRHAPCPVLVVKPPAERDEG